MRNMSKVAPGWWDYTTLDKKILDDAAKLTVKDIGELERPGFKVTFYDTLESFFNAEALEYIKSWMQSSESDPVGICGPIGPTEHLPLVAQMVNELELDIRSAHFWGMDEWFIEGRAVTQQHPLSFAKADMDLCFSKIDKRFRMPAENLHFLNHENLDEFTESFDKYRCAVIQGGQGEVKHWAFNDPPRREAPYLNQPPAPSVYREQGARVVDLHPMTIIQNARTSGGGVVSNIPEKALTVGPLETWKADRVSIWHPGWHDNPFGMRLTALMLSKRISDSSVPMSLLADHPHVQFNYYTGGIGSCDTEMH